MIDSFALHTSGRKIKLVIVAGTKEEAADIVSILRTGVYKYMYESQLPVKKKDC